MSTPPVLPRKRQPVSPQPVSPDLLLGPPRPWFIVVSLVIVLLLDLFPLNETLTPWRPEFVALVLIYWCIQAPRYVGVAAGFALGLVMDVANATVLGQHALAYTVLAFGADYLRRRLLSFPLWQQMLFVAVLLELTALLVFAVRMMSGGDWPPAPYFIAPPLSVLLWPLLRYLLQWPQRHGAAAER